MKKFRIMALICLTLLTVVVLRAEAFHVQTAGTLQAVLGDKADTLTQVMITGELNRDDMRYLGQLAKGKLVKIDISEAQLQPNEVPDECFEKSNLTEIVLPETLERIGGGAFSYTALETVNIPAGLKIMGAAVFMGCKSLKIKVLEFPSAMKTIHDAVFMFAEGIEQIVLPKTVEDINLWNFASGMSSLKKISLPEGITEIAMNAFSSTGLTEITIPESVTEIGTLAFGETKDLQQVKFPDKVEYIWERAFKDGGLKTVFLPAGLKGITFESFIDNRDLQAVYCPAVEPPALETEGWYFPEHYYNPMPFDLYQYEHATLYIPKGSLGAYQETRHWGLFQKIVELEDDEWPAGVDDVVAAPDFSVTARSGVLTVRSADPNPITVEVYSMAGALVMRLTVTSEVSVPLPAGLYVVRAAGHGAMKVAL